MAWEPTASVVVPRVATPEVLSVAEPSRVAPSLKATVPLGVDGPLLVVTVAVKVTEEPTRMEVALDETVVSVVACCTVSVSAADVLPASFVSPP